MYRWGWRVGWWMMVVERLVERSIVMVGMVVVG